MASLPASFLQAMAYLYPPATTLQHHTIALLSLNPSGSWYSQQPHIPLQVLLLDPYPPYRSWHPRTSLHPSTGHGISAPSIYTSTGHHGIPISALYPSCHPLNCPLSPSRSWHFTPAYYPSRLWHPPIWVSNNAIPFTKPYHLHTNSLPYQVTPLTPTRSRHPPTPHPDHRNPH